MILMEFLAVMPGVDMLFYGVISDNDTWRGISRRRLIILDDPVMGCGIMNAGCYLM